MTHFGNGDDDGDHAKSGGGSHWDRRTEPPDGPCGDRRAVSETVGFVLVFALITTTIAVTFTLGLGGLNDMQIAERDNNVERAFDVLHDNVQDVTRDGVPSRATEVRLAGGSLSLDDRTEIRLNSTDENWLGAYTETTRPIVYRGAGDTELIYENGAVFRTDGGRNVMLKEPDLLTGDTIVYSLTRLSGRDRSVGGDRTVLIVGSLVDREVVDREQSPTENVTLGISSPRADAWERYYQGLADDHDGISVASDPEGDVDVQVVFHADEFDRFVVHQTTVVVEFSN